MQKSICLRKRPQYRYETYRKIQMTVKILKTIEEISEQIVSNQYRIKFGLILKKSLGYIPSGNMRRFIRETLTKNGVKIEKDESTNRTRYWVVVEKGWKANEKVKIIESKSEKILKILYPEREMTAEEIKKALGWKSNSIYYFLRTLKKEGFIKISGAKKKYRKRVSVYKLTEKGELFVSTFLMS